MHIKPFKGPIFLPYSVVEKGSKVNAWQQRAVTGLATLCLAPMVDALNPFPDKKTKKYSMFKTIVKAIVGTSVGVGVRMGTQHLAKYLSDMGKMAPVAREGRIISKEQFVDNLSMFLGVVTCCFTNFLLDMPLTQHGLNWCVKKFKLDKGGSEKK